MTFFFIFSSYFLSNSRRCISFCKFIWNFTLINPLSCILEKCVFHKFIPYTGKMTTATATGFQAIEPFLVAYYSLFLMIAGTSLNILTFIIFCRAKFRKSDERPTIHYMRAIAIVDIMMLYGWNLDHYLANIYGFYIGGLSIGSCKFIIFLELFCTTSFSLVTSIHLFGSISLIESTSSNMVFTFKKHTDHHCHHHDLFLFIQWTHFYLGLSL